MNPLWRNRLAAFASAVLAIACGWWIAHGSYALPALLGAIGVAACAVGVFRLPFDAIVLGGLLLGYIVGNRGFAQFSLVPGLPLLPAEAGLAVCGAWLAVTSAFAKRLPVQRDGLNLAVVVWIAIGSIRLIPDVRTHGMIALRDFAMIYYALFFFIAQKQMEQERSRRFLESCLLAAVVIVIPLFELFRRFPEFFLGTLVVGGIPIIYFKGDLVATFMAVGVVRTHHQWSRTGKLPWLLISLLGVGGVLLTENRASLLGLCAATLWLAATRHWALLRTQVIAACTVALLMLGAVAIGLVPARDNFGYRFYERVASMVDFSGQRRYETTEVEFKGDNNQFRLVWWKTVADDTLANNPWLGLGFGHDLAAAFVRRYYPDSEEDFSTRSPHSIVLTVFGRTGAIGLLGFLWIVFQMARRTLRALRTADSERNTADAWLTAWIILVSACFGVVLEGPMGAVVFWIVLGIANGASPPRELEPPPAVPELARETSPAALP